MASMDWTENAIARLRALWDEGQPTAEIGRRLRVSKNAVIGKAHRLGLPPRRGPIQQGESAPRPVKPRKARGPTLPPVRPANADPPQPVRHADPPPARATHVPTAKPCCWPLGEPGQPGFRFCGEGAEAGKPYCPTHADAAYVRPKVARSHPDGVWPRPWRGLTRTA